LPCVDSVRVEGWWDLLTEQIAIFFRPSEPDAHNLDYCPETREWVEGAFPRAEIGTLMLYETGMLEPVGEDDFQVGLRVRNTRELADIIRFYRDARQAVFGAGPARKRHDRTRRMIERRTMRTWKKCCKPAPPPEVLFKECDKSLAEFERRTKVLARRKAAGSVGRRACIAPAKTKKRD